MHANKLESSRVRAALRRTGWLVVLKALAGDLLANALHRPGRHVACPIHARGRPGDGFRLFPDADRSGGGICATCGAYPDGFALLRWLHGWSFPAVLAAVASVVGMVAEQPLPAHRGRASPCPSPPPRDLDAARRQLRQVWNGADSVLGSGPLARYMKGRGLLSVPMATRVLRMHPALPYWTLTEAGRPRKLGAFPALLAMVQMPDGRPVTIHRTFLAPDGSGKAPVPKPKKLMPSINDGPIAGAAVRLFPAAETLGVAEGIETAWAAHLLSGMPVWACLSTSLLRGFVPPAGVRHVVVWADHDANRAGEEAACALRASMASGCSVEIRLPDGPPGIDWADAQQRSLRASP